MTQSSIVVGNIAREEQDRYSNLSWRMAGIVLGIGTQLLFVWTVVNLFQFLRNGAERNMATSLWVDVALALAFAVPHSLLLFPTMQKILKQHLPAEWLGCIHCGTTCLSLLVLFRYWSPSSATIWKFDGWPAGLVVAGFYASWIGLFYSLYLTGLGYQTGLTQWYYWLRKTTPPRREFVVGGPYRWLRHPVYLSFLGLIWFTPAMTLDHLVLTVVWTVYIFVGSIYKDRRLKKYIGKPYTEYAERVAGYPWVGFGSLGKWPKE